MNAKIFIPLVGQFTNVGDTMHRRVLLEWLEGCGELNLFLGPAPEDFVKGLNIPKDARVYRSFLLWYCYAFVSFWRAAFIYNPGEITGNKRRFLKELILWPLLGFYKLFRRPILKVGVDVRAVGLFDSLLYKATNFFTQYSYYRTNSSYCRFGKGAVIPDLAFSILPRNGVNGSNNKNVIGLSFRADRFLADDDFLLAVAKYAKKNDLAVAFVSQVKMDNVVCRELHQKFQDYNCETIMLDWPSNVSHLDQEERLAGLYSRCSVVISDRLHVLVAAANAGAVPLCMASYFSEKISSHFDVLGVDGVAVRLDSVSEKLAVIEEAASRGGEIEIRVAEAKAQLKSVREEVRQKILSSEREGV